MTSHHWIFSGLNRLIHLARCPEVVQAVIVAQIAFLCLQTPSQRLLVSV